MNKQVVFKSPITALIRRHWRVHTSVENEIPALGKLIFHYINVLWWLYYNIW